MPKFEFDPVIKMHLEFGMATAPYHSERERYEQALAYITKLEDQIRKLEESVKLAGPVGKEVW